VLSEEVVREIETAAAEYPYRHGAAIDALRIVQRHYKWVSDERLAATAALLGMSVEELDGIATFYSQIFRRPVGRHVIQICDSVVCWMVGQSRIQSCLERHGAVFGGTSADGAITLLPTPCLGACHRASAMLVDGELHEGLTVEGVEAMLARLP